METSWFAKRHVTKNVKYNDLWNNRHSEQVFFYKFDYAQVVLSVAWAGHKHFIVQTTAEGLYRFEGPAFPTVEELIAHQQECGLPVTTKSGAILKRSVPRETWELNNDDVELVEKIGSVSVFQFQGNLSLE